MQGGSNSAVSRGNQRWVTGRNDFGDIDTFCSEYGFYQGCEIVATLSRKPIALLEQRQQGSQRFDFSYIQRRLFSSSNGDINAQNGQKRGLFPSSSSLNLLRNHPTRNKNHNQEATDVDQALKLSADLILRLAGERFIQSSSRESVTAASDDDDLSYLSAEDKQDVELAQLLLTAAGKVCDGEFDGARELLSDCERLASKTGTPVQRAVFYFAEALQERIARETGQKTSTTKGEILKIESKWRYYRGILSWYQELPFIQVLQFAGIQAMLEAMTGKSRVHIIDIQMRTGVAWAVLMQDVAKMRAYSVEHLKITVIETTDRESVEATGRHLEHFARTLNLNFSFHIVFVTDIRDLTPEHIVVDPEEAVIVYAPIVLRTMIAKPVCLEALMNVIRRLNPSRMVVAEVEGNHNSPSFVNRFIEVLFYHGAVFDCLEERMARDDPSRIVMEAELLSHAIHNSVAMEGSERDSRSVQFEVWRAFFRRFGMVESEVSASSLFKAVLVGKSLSCDSCTLETRGSCLIVGWKGTPIFSLSSWRFT